MCALPSSYSYELKTIRAALAAVLNFLWPGFAAWLVAEWDESPSPVEVISARCHCKDAFSAARNRESHPGPFSRRAGPRTTAGNGKTMAENNRKSNHTEAKGRTTDNGKPSRSTNRRPRAAARTTLEREEAPATQAETQPPAARGDGGYSDPELAGMRGVDQFYEHADMEFKIRGKELAKNIMDMAVLGDKAAIKSIFKIADGIPPATAKRRSRGRALKGFREVVKERDYDHPAEEKQDVSPSPGGICKPVTAGEAV